MPPTARAASVVSVAMTMGAFCIFLTSSGCAGTKHAAPSEARARAGNAPAMGPRDEALAMACDGGDTLSCGRLGMAYFRGDGVAKDLARAESFYKKACVQGLAPSCTNWGALIFKRAPAEAYGAYQRACAGGDAAGCFDEGFALAAGQGVAKDPERAAKLFLNACDRGHPPGCGMVGRAYMNGEGLPKDPAKATPYLVRACDGDLSKLAQSDGSPLPNMAETCATAATLLAPSAHSDGEKRRVATMLDRACDWGYVPACNDAGTTYLELETEGDKARGMATLGRACDKGDPTACGNLGTLLMKTDPIGAVPLLQKSCDGKNGQSCANLGVMYTSGTGVVPDLARAAGMFERACDAGNLLGCLFAGGVYYEGKGVPEDRPRARTYLDKACDGGIGKGCSALAHMYEYAIDVDEDMTRAAAYRKRACDDGEADDCARITAASPVKSPKKRQK